MGSDTTEWLTPVQRMKPSWHKENCRGRRKGLGCLLTWYPEQVRCADCSGYGEYVPDLFVCLSKGFIYMCVYIGVNIG